MKLGEFEIHPLSDGSFALDGGQMFGVVPKVLWEKKMAADARNRVRLGLTCLLVQAGGQNVLIETGIGDKFDEKHALIYAIDHSTNLLADLAQHGLSPEDINVVINTHLHFDHCGWNTRREGAKTVPTFPRARYVVQRGEWQHACHPSERDRSSYLEEWFVAAEPQTELVEGSCEVVPGIRVEPAPGHTKNLQCVWVESEGERACFISDLVPTHAHVPYPWIMAFDLYPMETLSSRKHLMPVLAEERALVVFPHDPEFAWGRLNDRDGNLVFEAVAES